MNFGLCTNSQYKEVLDSRQQNIILNMCGTIQKLVILTYIIYNIYYIIIPKISLSTDGVTLGSPPGFASIPCSDHHGAEAM